MALSVMWSLPPHTTMFVNVSLPHVMRFIFQPTNQPCLPNHVKENGKWQVPLYKTRSSVEQSRCHHKMHTHVNTPTHESDLEMKGQHEANQFSKKVGELECGVTLHAAQAGRPTQREKAETARANLVAGWKGDSCVAADAEARCLGGTHTQGGQPGWQSRGEKRAVLYITCHGQCCRSAHAYALHGLREQAHTQQGVQQ